VTTTPLKGEGVVIATGFSVILPLNSVGLLKNSFSGDRLPVVTTPALISLSVSSGICVGFLGGRVVLPISDLISSFQSFISG
jgi:hypothetical protein